MIPELPSAGTESASIGTTAGDLALGTILDDQFEIGSVIGRGGMAVVYQAKDLRIDRVVALKMLNQHLRSDDAALKRFQREAVAVATLSHPNIISVFGFGAWKGQPYVSMELLDGVTLADLVRGNANLTLEYKIDVFLQILDALSYAHAKGIIHRDLKPRNVMVINANSMVKLLDFGIAKILPQSGKQIQTLTQTGELFGTVSYMSPEQCRGESLDARSDIYSMGCLMYEVLSGHPPFEGSSAYAVLAKHLDQEGLQPPCQDLAISRVVLSALEKDPAMRPQSADDLAQALRRPEAYSPMRRRGASRLPWKKTVMASVAVTVIAVSAICAMMMTNRFRPESPPSPPEDQVVSRESPGSILDEATDLFEERRFAEGVRLLRRNAGAFSKDSALRVKYYNRLVSLEGDAVDPHAESDAREAVRECEALRGARHGQFGYEPDYIESLLALSETLLFSKEKNIDEAISCARKARAEIIANSPDRKKSDFAGRFEALAVRFNQFGRHQAAAEFMDTVKRLLAPDAK